MSDISDLLLKEIRDRMNRVADEIILNPLTLDEYRKMQGRVEELALMERYILDHKKTELEE